MKKIVIIGANSFQNPLILKAKSMGYETHVFAWRDGAVGEKTADYFYPVSIVEKEKILEICKTIHPDAVASIASDLAGITVNYLAEELGLTGNSMQCVQCSTNKYQMRKTFRAAGIPTPGFAVVSGAENAALLKDMRYPLIVKPTDRSGSRGITKISSEKELPAAIGSAVGNSFENKAIVEEFIDGDEYSCECISFAGEHYFLSLTKKFTTGAPHFIETGHMQPSGISPQMEKQVVAVAFSALDALGVKYGASHTEFKIDQHGDIRIIEIGARMGGDCIGSDLVQISTGYDFVRMVIEVASGVKPVLKQVSQPKVAVIQFVFGTEDIDRLQFIREQAPETLYYVSEMETPYSHEIVDSSTRYGYYILSCESIEQAKRLCNL